MEALAWIQKAMKSDYGDKWERMDMGEQLAAISAFMRYYNELLIKTGKIYQLYLKNKNL